MTEPNISNGDVIEPNHHGEDPKRMSGLTLYQVPFKAEISDIQKAIEDKAKSNPHSALEFYRQLSTPGQYHIAIVPSGQQSTNTRTE